MARKKKTGDKFVGIFSQMYKSTAFQNLSPNAVRILVEFKWRYNGYNNGEISLSIRECCNICRIGRDSSTRAIMELLTHGFIRIRKVGLFSTNKATEFELTFEKAGNRAPRNDWRDWPDNDGNKIRGKSLYEYEKNLDGYLATQINRLN